ncbi:MAG: hypothetical protein AB4080_01980 [Trichodesmium sp.]
MLSELTKGEQKSIAFYALLLSQAIEMVVASAYNSEGDVREALVSKARESLLSSSDSDVSLIAETFLVSITSFADSFEHENDAESINNDGWIQQE